MVIFLSIVIPVVALAIGIASLLYARRNDRRAIRGADVSWTLTRSEGTFAVTNFGQNTAENVELMLTVDDAQPEFLTVQSVRPGHSVTLRSQAAVEAIRIHEDKALQAVLASANLRDTVLRARARIVWVSESVSMSQELEEHFALEVARPEVSFVVEQRYEQFFSLLNQGPRRATDVRMHEVDGAGPMMDLARGVDLEPGERWPFRMMGSVNSPIPTYVPITCAELPCRLRVPVPPLE